VRHRHPLAIAICAALCLSILAIPSAASAKGKYRVSISPSTRTLVQGNAVSFTGRVSPTAKGKKVQLQVRYSSKGKWTKERTARISRKGTYRVTDRPTTIRQRWYRVVSPKTKKRAAGASPAVHVVIYGWQYLSDYTQSSAETIKINGTPYANSYDHDDSYSEFDLSRRCVQLTTVFGMADASDSGADAQIDFSNDGRTVYSKRFVFGQSEPVTIDVTNVLRVKFSVEQLADEWSTDSYGAMGSPRVLCRA
jgi:hypothetical protein